MDGTRVVTLEVDEDSVTFECTVVRTDALAACLETERTGLDAWSIELRVEGPDDDPTAFALLADRGDEDTAGPSEVQLTVSVDGSPALFRTVPKRQESVAVDGQVCTRCSFSMDEQVQLY